MNRVTILPFYREDTQRQSVGKLSERVNQSFHVKNNYNIDRKIDYVIDTSLW